MVQTPRTQALQIGQAELEIHLESFWLVSDRNSGGETPKKYIFLRITTIEKYLNPPEDRENMGDFSICFRKHGDETRIHCIFPGKKYGTHDDYSNYVKAMFRPKRRMNHQHLGLSCLF